jgi:hypothetical protein
LLVISFLYPVGVLVLIVSMSLGSMASLISWDATINQDFLYGPDFINRAVITPDGLFIDGKLAVV